MQHLAAHLRSYPLLRLVAGRATPGGPVAGVFARLAAIEGAVTIGLGAFGARARLDDIGASPEPRSVQRTGAGWASLTDTEHHVSELVAEGLTNRQIGERMFLSHHTVDFHLRQIIRRLGINSRVQLTRLKIERDATAG